MERIPERVWGRYLKHLLTQMFDKSKIGQMIRFFITYILQLLHLPKYVIIHYYLFHLDMPCLPGHIINKIGAHYFLEEP